MDTSCSISLRTIKSVIFDLHAIVLVYFIPSLVHLTGIPLYYAEPMRIMLILALVHTNKVNAYVLAATLPLFSFAIASHPVFLKSMLIALELSLNVYLFYLLLRFMKSVFPAILLSIVLSKLIYYVLKFTLLSFMLIDGSLISTPLYFQLITSLVLSAYVFFFLKKQSKT